MSDNDELFLKDGGIVFKLKMHNFLTGFLADTVLF